MKYGIKINPEGYVTATWYCDSVALPSGYTEITDERLFYELHNGLTLPYGGPLKWRVVDSQFVQQTDTRRVFILGVPTGVKSIGGADVVLSVSAMNEKAELDTAYNDTVDIDFGSVVMVAQFIDGVALLTIPTFGAIEFSPCNTRDYRFEQPQRFGIEKV